MLRALQAKGIAHCHLLSSISPHSAPIRSLPRFFSSQQPPPPPPLSESELRKYLGYAGLFLFCGVATYYSFPFSENAKHKKAYIFRYAPLPEDIHTVSNWSGTHEAQTRVFIQPENLSQLEDIVRSSHKQGQKLRPVGSGLSPNGIGLARAGMVNLALMDKVLDIDKENKRVTVQAGIRVQQLVDAIKDQGLTLQNFASIREQQVGGIIQVGAHGTGARIPPVDEQVIGMKLVTPTKGTIEISKEKDPELFYLARCGLGALGVVAEVTLQCVERHELVEHTFVSNFEHIKKNHKKLLSENKHVKYLHIPYTETIVVVTCNPLSKWRGPPKFKPKYTQDEAIQHVRDLYRHYLQIKSPSNNEGEAPIEELSFPEIRDKLLALDPLNKTHVAKINEAEAEFWRKSEGYRVGWSDEILGFDCGGQQWVSETCFPAGSVSNPTGEDLDYMEEVKKIIEREEIPAPAPIEQRWSTRTRSTMSPAYSSEEDALFSWVGIIMYLPTADPRQRKEITDEFRFYKKAVETELWDKYSAYEHWAKIEVPRDVKELGELQTRLRSHFPVDAYNSARKELDPNFILSNHVIKKLFPKQSQ